MAFSFPKPIPAEPVLSPEELRYRLALAKAKLITIEASLRDNTNYNMAEIISRIDDDFYETLRFLDKLIGSKDGVGDEGAGDEI